MAHKHSTMTTNGAVYCNYSGDTVEECEEAEREAQAEFGPKPGEMIVTCNECGYSGSIERVKLHSCQIQQQGGRCEDYPCCGHTDGDGCQTLPEHTADYWLKLMSEGSDRYDEMDAAGVWDR